jgi:tRNA pseudouridine55 synthase
LATGLLVLCIGEATKIAGFIEAEEKQYRATALLGRATDTQDITGETIAEASLEGLTEQAVRSAANSFVGTIEQTPPAFSAIKVDGVRSYKRARNKEEVRLKARTIKIGRLEIERVELPRVEFFVECSKGTYIRTLCSDLGEMLGVGGCLEKLRRLAVGEMNVEKAAQFAALDGREKILEALIPASLGLTSLAIVRCGPESYARLANGSALDVGDSVEPPGKPSCKALCKDEAEAGSPGKERWAQALGPDGTLLAIGRIVVEGEKTLFRPKRVLVGWHK